ncbi:MAG: hypothetical protein RIR33_1132 [Pseudomonadota bacterium]|jgi:hypothetical protein
MAKSPEEQTRAMIAGMKERTGKAMPDWLKIARASKLEKHGEIVAMLKAKHGMTHGFANLVAHTLLGSLEQAPGSAEDPAAGQYEGAKAKMRPVYDRLAEAARALGDDVQFAPKKGYVSLRRNKQFCTIHASTADRVDVGLQLKGVAPAGRLEAAGSWNAMVSHRVRVGAVGEVDRQLLGWLKQAYAAC